jgi:hypothetical protein
VYRGVFLLWPREGELGLIQSRRSTRERGKERLSRGIE